MASGDLTASTPTVCATAAEIKTAVDALNLTAVTDQLIIVPLGDIGGTVHVFKVERAA